MSILFNTDVNAPCCPGEIVEILPNGATGRTILVQTDWDYPSIASSFGWNIQDVQPECADCGDPTEHCACANTPCEHTETDGRVVCKGCGLTATDFISAASDYLDDANGMEADNPGYF